MIKDHEARMSLSEHLEELRHCLFRALIGLLVASAICWFQRDHLLEIVRWPLLDSGFEKDLTSYSPMETIVTYLKISIVGGAVLSSPWVTFQIWRFVGAGLYPQERWMFYKYAGGATFFFLLGVAFSYFFLTPMILGVLISFNPEGVVTQEMRTTEYVGFFFKFTLAMGMSFQVPMMMKFMSEIGIVERSFWITYRKYAMAGAFVAAALITPQDPFSMVSAAIPMIILYEIGILLIPSTQNETMEQDDQTDQASNEKEEDEA